MGNAAIIAVLALILIIAFKGSIKHLKGTSGCMIGSAE